MEREIVVLMKILIVDDHPIFIDGLKSVLVSNIEPLTVLQAPNVEDAIRILDSSEIDLVLLDFRMPELDGIDFLKAYRARGGNSPVAMISSDSSPEIAHRALKNGANGYLPKSLDSEEFLIAIQFILQGKQYLTRSMRLKIDNIEKNTKPQQSNNGISSDKDLIEIAGQYSFTKRQIEVLELISKGHTNKHISNILHISVNTVKEHVHNIFLLMDVGTRGQCIAKINEHRK